MKGCAPHLQRFETPSTSTCAQPAAPPLPHPAGACTGASIPTAWKTPCSEGQGPGEHLQLTHPPAMCQVGGQQTACGPNVACRLAHRRVCSSAWCQWYVLATETVAQKVANTDHLALQRRSSPALGGQQPTNLICIMGTSPSARRLQRPRPATEHPPPRPPSGERTHLHATCQPLTF